MQIPGYRIIRKIAQGGMSTVYLAIQISVGRVVALKVMSPTLNGDPEFSERFQREANIVGQLSHPNIVSIYDIGRHDGLNYIAMDYLPGGSVHDRMMKGLTADEALRVAREIASALDHAHERGYIHRDIKPENILFRSDGSAVLSDFGVAKGIIGASRMTNVGQIVGTPHYMSPEQARGRPVDARSDLYSLGIVLYEMFTGSVPFHGDAAVAIAIKHLSAPIPKLPPHYQIYQKLIDKLLDKDPDQRFQRGQELVGAIELLESVGRNSYATISNPTDLSTLALLKALFAATSDALRRQAKRLLRLRWTPQRGLYYHPEARVTEVLISGSEDDRATAIATRTLRATHFLSLRNDRQRMTSRIVIGAIFVTIIWCGLSVLIERNRPAIAESPKGIRLLTHATASLFLGESEQPQTSASSTSASLVAQSQAAVSEAASTSETHQETGEAAPPSAQIARDAEENTTSGNDEVAESDNLESTGGAVEPPPSTYSLTVDTIPSNARVRIMNIPERYEPGMQLQAGRYLIEVSHPGFVTKSEWVEITDQDFQPSYSLDKIIPPSKNFVSDLGDNKKGPEMVRIPAGNFVMGNKSDNTSSPVHNVHIAEPFAISKFEITFSDYDLFATDTGRELPKDNRWGRNDRPVINVSWNDAQAYVTWLSKKSGKTYRLPTESEWEYVARAGTMTLYWWGDDEKGAIDRANCRRGCYSSFAGLFSSKTAPVGTYPANKFGIYDMSGNVAEWVQDCYADNYNEKATDGSAYETRECSRRVARGGSAKSTVDQIANYVRAYFPPELYNENLGFRVVMELEQ